MKELSYYKMIDFLFQMIVNWEDQIIIIDEKNLLERDKLVVLKNELSPVVNDCRLGRYKH